DELRTEPPSLAAAHRGADAVRLCLVARGEDHSPADDHRTAPQRGVVTLLHRCVEGVEVGVEDRRLIDRSSRRHEHMFALRYDDNQPPGWFAGAASSGSE